MQDEAEKPTTEKESDRPSRMEILVVGTAWALFVVTLVAGLRIWTGGSN